MHYAQRLLAALPSTRLGARAILAVLTAFGIILTTAGVAAMPLLNEGNVVEESEGGAACRPTARMVYPEGQSAPEYVVPVYETGIGVGVESILSDWCDAAGEVLEDPAITLNVVEGKTVTPHLLPGIHAELERPAPANGEQDVFIPTDYLVRGMRQATGDNTWDVGKRVYSLTFTSGTVSATTGMFSFVKQDPDIVNPPSPDPTTEPSAEPSAEPTPQPTAEPTSEPEPTTEPTNEPTAAPTTGPTAEPAPEPTQKPTPTPSATPSSEPTATATHSATPGPTPTSSASPTNTTCQVAPTASVLTPDGAEPKGTEPVYDPEVAVRVSGTGWCSQGTMLDGEKSVEIKMMAHGGYAVPGTVSVPVTFHNGSFGAQLNLSALYAAGKVEKGHYYLQISPIETGLTAGTNVFVLNKSVTPQPVPTPTAGPTAEPSTGPAPAPSGEPTSEPSAAPSASAPPTQPTSPKTGSESATDTSGGNVPSNQGSGSGGQSDTGSSSDVSDRSDSSDRSDADAPPADVPAEPGADQGRAQDSDHRSNSDTSATEDSRASTQADAGTAALEDRTVRPTANPVAPVSSSAQLSADNAGSLSGSRQGNVVNLVLPKAKVSAGEWVSVFVFPGATTKGWVQVDDANSVSIDISTFESGSYELAVADRDNSLLGWAKLEITSASFDPRSPAQAQLLTFPDDDSSTPMGLSTNDMLLGGAGGLLVIGAGSLLVAAHSGMPLRVPHAPRRPRIPRRR
ncbi:hypothetical protein [Actinomyces naeslundii]|uniref:hypothetical protein n=1 Tax=Actinomyces naeslundii TaxID=1655 RepID=UPI00094D8C57|nr:hypothetical protein [Actinomyces naeslundii]OLO86614.1 hypothetical protein BKH12_01980 [Actinomyces naeslundii]